jgi:hypothetical protein
MIRELNSIWSLFYPESYLKLLEVIRYYTFLYVNTHPKALDSKKECSRVLFEQFAKYFQFFTIKVCCYIVNKSFIILPLASAES